ncbi:MAG: hypothetical protein ACXWTX_02595 [Gallionella sp.]
MFELIQFVKALAIRSWEYNTYRGRWDDLPNSTPLCWVLAVISFVVCVATMYAEYGMEGAIALPSLWLASLWMMASTGGTWFDFDKRLLTAIFLSSTPVMLLLMIAGQGQYALEIFAGVHLSASIIKLKTAG